MHFSGSSLGHFSGSCLWVMYLGHVSGSLLWFISLRHFSGMSLGNVSGSFLWVMSLGHFSGSCLWVISLGHVSGSFLWVIPLGCFSGSFLWVISLSHFSTSQPSIPFSGSCLWVMSLGHLSGSFLYISAETCSIQSGGQSLRHSHKSGIQYPVRRPVRRNPLDIRTNPASLSGGSSSANQKSEDVSAQTPAYCFPAIPVLSHIPGSRWPTTTTTNY